MARLKTSQKDVEDVFSCRLKGARARILWSRIRLDAQARRRYDELAEEACCEPLSSEIWIGRAMDRVATRLLFDMRTSETSFDWAYGSKFWPLWLPRIKLPIAWQWWRGDGQ